jgi:hypothetical protein
MKLKMLKLKTTKKAVLEAVGEKGVIFALPYCYIENKLTFIDYMISPCAYTCGVYGWNCDIYDLGGFLLTEGYRPFNHSTNKQQKEFYKVCERFAEVWEKATDKDYSIPREKSENFFTLFSTEVARVLKEINDK